MGKGHVVYIKCQVPRQGNRIWFRIIALGLLRERPAAIKLRLPEQLQVSQANRTGTQGEAQNQDSCEQNQVLPMNPNLEIKQGKKQTNKKQASRLKPCLSGSALREYT